MKRLMVAIAFSLFGCSCSGDYVLSRAELEERLATAICQRKADCAIQPFAACVAGMQGLFRQYEPEGWPAESYDSDMQACESFVESLTCEPTSVWLADACDFGQQYR
jgi:hypothetical protein